MSSFGAVLDACVLIPAALRDTLLRAAREGLYRSYWSEMILDEVHRNLVKSGMMTPDQASYLTGTLREKFPRALAEGFEPLIPSMTNHPKDRHVVAAAVVAHAQVIVTFNLRDFPATALTPHGIEARHPDTFLTSLANLEPEVMAGVIERQAAALRNPPKTYDEILDNLTGQTPRFATLMRGANTR